MTGGDEFLRTQSTATTTRTTSTRAANWLDWTLDTRPDELQHVRPAAARLPQGAPGAAPGELLLARRQQRERDGAAPLVQAGRHRRPTRTYWNDANNHALAWRIDGTEFGDSAPAPSTSPTTAGPADVTFTLPWPGTGKSWYRVTDTCTWAEGAEPGRAPRAPRTFIGGEWTHVRRVRPGRAAARSRSSALAALARIED